MSAEERAAIELLWCFVVPELIGDLAPAARTVLDRLLSTPGQGARPAAGEVAEQQPGPDPSAVYPALCRRLASETAEDDARMTPGPWHVVAEPQGNGTLVDDPGHQTVADCDQRYDEESGGPQSRSNASAIARTRNNLPEVARQLTAAADLREAFDSLLVVAKDAQDQLIEERDAERRELATLKQRNAADRAAVQATLTAQDANVARLIIERDAARAECERLRGEIDTAWALLDGTQQETLRQAAERVSGRCTELGEMLEEENTGFREAIALYKRMQGAIRALLATEPAVSEERCGEIDRTRAGRGYHVDDLLAAARQMHALRAGLQQIVGGEPAPRAWAVTPGRVEALRYALELVDQVVSGQARDERRAIAAMLAVTDERLKLALRDVGADHTSDPHWQERVLAAVAEPASSWHRYRLALWIGLAVAAAVVGLVWVA